MAPIELRFTGWERLGDRGGELRRRNVGGWDGLLRHYRRACLDRR
jgi:hypothetical protein